MQNTIYDPSTESRFTGGALANWFIGVLIAIVGVCTLGFGVPTMLCWKWQN